MNGKSDALDCLLRAWPAIRRACLEVLGSELHYQAVIYRALVDEGGVPVRQIGMNVKMWIEGVTTPLFRELDDRKQSDFQGGFEPIPDVALFMPAIDGDFRRRNYQATLREMCLAIEVKASERAGARLRAGEIRKDILKLAAHREEAVQRGGGFHPVMLIIDTAPIERERMTSRALEESRDAAREACVGLLYVSPVAELVETHCLSSQRGDVQ